MFMLGLPLLSEYWFVAAIHLLALASSWLARMTVRSRYQLQFQWLFVVMLITVATLTGIAAVSGTQHLLMSGGTLALMVVIVMCDFRHSLGTGAT